MEEGNEKQRRLEDGNEAGIAMYSEGGNQKDGNIRGKEEGDTLENSRRNIVHPSNGSGYI